MVISYGIAFFRNAPKPTHMSAQLTIFYAGSVNVFDDVPLDKVFFHGSLVITKLEG